MNRDELMKTLKATGIDCDRAEDYIGDGEVVGYVQEQQMEYNSNFADWDPVRKEWRIE